MDVVDGALKPPMQNSNATRKFKSILTKLILILIKLFNFFFKQKNNEFSSVLDKESKIYLLAIIFYVKI